MNSFVFVVLSLIMCSANAFASDGTRPAYRDHIMDNVPYEIEQTKLSSKKLFCWLMSEESEGC